MNAALDDIVRMGVPSIPYTVEKIDKNPDRFRLIFQLEVAMLRLTKVRFRREEYADPGDLGDARTKAAMFVHWWREGRKQTPQRFAKLYAGWREDRKQGRAREAEDKHRRMVDLGIAALPHMVEKVAAGDAALIPAISRLTDAAVPKNATPGECTAWWAKNKQKWTLPPVAPQRDG